MTNINSITTITKEAEKAWANLSLVNNFIFQKVMLNEELCEIVLSEILGFEITRIEYPEYEKTIDIRFNQKSI